MTYPLSQIINNRVVQEDSNTWGNKDGGLGVLAGNTQIEAADCRFKSTYLYSSSAI